jgi:hypothetical protein
MYDSSSHCYLTEKAVADPAFENFYTVVITIDHVGGCQIAIPRCGQIPSRNLIS